MTKKTYATAILCMDGAYTGGLRKELKRRHGVNFMDIIPQPGIVRVLAENTNAPRLDLIREMIQISVKAHGSRVIAISAHHNCLGNPVGKEKQLKQLPIARKTVQRMVRELKLDHLQIQYPLFWMNQDGLPEEVHISPNGHIFSRELVFVEMKSAV